MSKEKQLDDVLREYIEECDEFEHLQDDDKIFIYSSLKKILRLLELVIKHPNVNPILFVHSVKTKSILEDLMAESSSSIEFTALKKSFPENIRLSVAE